MGPTKPMQTNIVRFKNSVGSLPAKNSRSRGGCFACKTARVKCDEVKPNCARCKKKDVKCAYNIKEIIEKKAVKANSPLALIAESVSTLPDLLRSDPILTSYFQYFYEVISYLVFPSTTKVMNGTFRNPFITVLPQIAVSDNSVLGVCLAIAMVHKSLLMSEPVPFDLVSKIFKLAEVPYKFDDSGENLLSRHGLDNAILVKLLLVSFGLTLYQSDSDDWRYHLKQARGLFYNHYILPNKDKIFRSDTKDGSKAIDQIFNSDLKRYLVNSLGFYSVHVLLSCSLNYDSSRFFYESLDESNHFDQFWTILSQNDNRCVGNYSLFSQRNTNNLGHHLFIFDFSYLPICHSIVALIYRKNKNDSLEDLNDDANHPALYHQIKKRLKDNHSKIQDRHFRLTLQNLTEPDDQQKLLDFYYNLNEIFYHTFLIHINRRLIDIPTNDEEIQYSCNEIIKYIKASVDGDSVFETSIFASLCMVSFESNDADVVKYCRKRITEHSIGYGRPIDCLIEFWASNDHMSSFSYTKGVSFTQFFEQYNVKSSLF